MAGPPSLNIVTSPSIYANLRAYYGLSGRGAVAPRRLRVYANRPTGVGFDEAEVLKPQLDLALLEGETSVTEYPLRVAVFSNVFSISLFFVSLMAWTDQRDDSKLNTPIWQSESNEEEMSRVYYVSSLSNELSSHPRYFQPPALFLLSSDLPLAGHTYRSVSKATLVNPKKTPTPRSRSALTKPLKRSSVIVLRKI